MQVTILPESSYQKDVLHAKNRIDIKSGLSII